MLSEELETVVAEVENLKNIPAGPRRGAACGQPRRHIWDHLASLQDYLVVGEEDDARARAKEVQDHCCRLQDLLASLRILDISSRESQWALTDYAALAAELEDQKAAAAKLLILDDDCLAELVPSTESQPAIACTTSDGTVKMRIKDVNDLRMEYPCGWSGDGVCDRGCMVGGCEFHSHASIEAW